MQAVCVVRAEQSRGGTRQLEEPNNIPAPNADP